MLSRKTLRVLTILSNRDKIRAEQMAADAAKRLAALGGQSATLSAYMTDLGRRLVEEGITSGLELKSYGQFIEMGVRARHANEAQIRVGENAQKQALDSLALATEKHKALQKAADAARAAADRLAERADDHAAGAPSPAAGSASASASAAGASGGSSGPSTRGRAGFSPPSARQASSRQT